MTAQPETAAGRALSASIVLNCDRLNVGVLREGILAIEAEARAAAVAPSYGESNTETGRRLAALYERALRGETWPSTTDEEVAFLFDQIARHESAARIAGFARSEALAESGRLREALKWAHKAAFDHRPGDHPDDCLACAALVAATPPVPSDHGLDDHLRGDHELWPGEGD